MYSWRAHIGLLAPGSGPNMEMDFHRFLPAGVAVATSRLPFTIPSPQGLLDMVAHLENACEVYRRYRHDVIMFGCTSGSLIGGPGFDRELITRMEAITGDPCLTTSTAVLEAFQALGVSRRSSSRPIPTTPTRRKKSFWKTTAFRYVSFPAWATIMSTSPLPISNRTMFFRRSSLCRATERTACSSAARDSMCWISSLCWRQTGGCRSLPAIRPLCGPVCGIPA